MLGSNMRGSASDYLLSKLRDRAKHCGHRRVLNSFSARGAVFLQSGSDGVDGSLRTKII